MRVAKIIPNDVANGQGICVSLFVQGCDRHCHGCFNPETWDINGGTDIKDEDVIRQVFNLLYKNNISRNLSILGGEPLLQSHAISLLVEAVKIIYPQVQIWLWTGYTYEDILLLAQHNRDIQNILNTIDVLVDGPYMETERDITLPFRGSANQRLIDIKETRKNHALTLFDIKQGE